MLGKKKRVFGFGDLKHPSREKALKEHILTKIDKLIDWTPIEKELEKLYPSKKGRPSFPVLTMFKILLLQQWYNLSDPEAEFAVADRMVFQKFLGISVSEPVPDETTICRFRNRIKQKGISERLFKVVNNQLETKGYIVKKITLIDASLIKSKTKPLKKNDSSDTKKDKDATWTVKNGKPHFGYKAHIATDKNGLIKKNRITPAHIHDSCVFDNILPPDTKAVFSDKGYASHKRKRQLRKQGIYPGILDKAYKNTPLSSKQIRNNKRKSRIRRTVEHVFAHIKTWYGYVKVKYIGMEANQNHFNLLAIAYNLKRAVKMVSATG